MTYLNKITRAVLIGNKKSELMQNEADPNELSTEDRDALFPQHAIVPLPPNLKAMKNAAPSFPAGPPAKKKGEDMTL